MPKEKNLDFEVRLPYSRSVHKAVTGEPFEDAFVLERTKAGSEIVRNGKINSYAMIQSHADSVSMDVILAKFMAGDTSVINKRHGFYGDVTSLPTNLHELYNDISRAESAFSELPLEVRAKYNHDPAQFFADSNAVAQVFGATSTTVVSDASSAGVKDVAGASVNPVDVVKEGEN